ncbi:MAG: hypothetical protein LUI12_06235 [Clostridiales bacterium]|nr:hypothetical protein [Clostridiales bacterium]
MSDREKRQILEEIDRLLAGRQEPVIVAIDGVCGGGKTTLGEWLAGRYECNLFHMDDFFLRKEQRTGERYAQPGGNVDYERFYEEILRPILAGGECAYRRLDCASLTLEEPKRIGWKRLNIVEGSYSQHPYFGNPYQMRIFLDLSPQEQYRRLAARDPEKIKRYVEEWIPMENRYFEAYGIRERSMCVGNSAANLNQKSFNEINGKFI